MKGSKSEATENLLGCTFEESKVHIENQFIDNMNWKKLWRVACRS